MHEGKGVILEDIGAVLEKLIKKWKQGRKLKVSWRGVESSFLLEDYEDFSNIFLENISQIPECTNLYLIKRDITAIVRLSSFR